MNLLTSEVESDGDAVKNRVRYCWLTVEELLFFEEIVFHVWLSSVHWSKIVTECDKLDVRH